METLIFLLPLIDDPDEDDTHSFTLETDASFVSLDSDLKTLFIEPQLGDQGSYSVSVTATDSDSANTGQFLSVTDTFSLDVLEEEPEVVEEQETEESEESEVTVVENQWQAFIVEEMDPPSATISKVSSYGEVTIKFSQEMMVPANLT